MSWLSSLWKKEGEKDRCGGGFLHTPQSDKLTPACEVHDHEYVKAESGEQTKSRKQVDDQFLDQMLTLVAYEKNSWKRGLLTVQAYTYYGIVRLVGGLFWDGER